MNETLKTIHSLHSTHGNFSEREVSAEDLQTVLAAAVKAATASARQSYSIVVVDDRPAMKAYLDYAGSKALIFCVDYTRLVDTAAHLGRSYACGGLQNFITGSMDTILAAQTAAIAARSLGIDSLFTNSVHRHDLSRFYERFNLPARLCFPLIALILGYADNTSREQKGGRLLEQGVVHYGTYRRLTEEGLARLVADYDDPQKKLGLVFHNNEDYLEWFFDIWCKSAESDDPGDPRMRDLYAVLHKAGFLNPAMLRVMD